MKKRVLALGLAICLVLCLLTACGGGQEPPAGDAGSPAPAAPADPTVPAPTPEPVTSPGPTPEPVSAAEPTPEPVSDGEPGPEETPVPTPVATETPAPTPAATPEPTPTPTPTPEPTPAPKGESLYQVTVNGAAIAGRAFEADERIWVPVEETLAALRYDWSYDAAEEFPLKLVTPNTTYSMSPPSVKEKDGKLYFYAYMLTIFMDDAKADVTADGTSYAITCRTGDFTGAPKGILSPAPASGGSSGGEGGAGSGTGGSSSGVTVCSTCGGSGRVFCVSCVGMGQKSSTTMQYNPITKLYENRTTYTACTACGGSGRSICTSCGGSGHR